MARGVVTIPLSGQPLGGHAPPKASGKSVNEVPDATRRDKANGTVSPMEFFAGPENCLVEPAVLGILGQRQTPFNPLVLYGASGTGKSHLVRGIAATWKASYPQSRVVYTTAVDFAREMADAFEAQAVEEFRDKYRGAALAVFEDLGELAAKAAAQEELICTLDAILAHGGQVLATAPAAPHEIGGLTAALQSRLAAGLCLPLTPPGSEARRAILARWSALRNFDLGDAVLRVLAEGLAGTVPELLSAMLQLELPARQEGRSIDARQIREFLARRDAAVRPKLRDIAALAARHFSLRLSDLRGSSRRRPVVIARDVAIYLCRQLTRDSLSHIGEYFGGRDHTTVLHACRKIEEQIELDPAIQQAIDHLHRKLTPAAK